MTESEADPVDGLVAAMTATGVNVRGMSYLLAVDERTIRRYLDGTRKVPGPVRQLCALFHQYPQLSHTILKPSA